MPIRKRGSSTTAACRLARSASALAFRSMSISGAGTAASLRPRILVLSAARRRRLTRLVQRLRMPGAATLLNAGKPISKRGAISKPPPLGNTRCGMRAAKCQRKLWMVGRGASAAHLSTIRLVSITSSDATWTLLPHEVYRNAPLGGSPYSEPRSCNFLLRHGARRPIAGPNIRRRRARNVRPVLDIREAPSCIHERHDVIDRSYWIESRLVGTDPWFVSSRSRRIHLWQEQH